MFLVITMGKRVPGILLNILQCKRQSTQQTTNPVQRESSFQVCENISSIGTPKEAILTPKYFGDIFSTNYHSSEGSSAPWEFQLVKVDFKWLILPRESSKEKKKSSINKPGLNIKSIIYMNMFQTTYIIQISISSHIQPSSLKYFH